MSAIAKVKAATAEVDLTDVPENGPSKESISTAFPLLEEYKHKGINYTTTLLQGFIRKYRKVDTEVYPSHHFVSEQVICSAYDYYVKMKTRRLTFREVRENFENLGVLFDSLRIADNGHTAAVLGNLLQKLMILMAELAEDLEKLSDVPITDWLLAGQQFVVSEQSTVEPDVITMVPKLKVFNLGKLLGAGGFGCVYRAVFGEVTCTVKFVPTNMLAKPKLACVDKVVASQTNHPLVCKYYSTFAAKQAYVTVMEYICGVDVNKVLRKCSIFPEDVAKVVIAQLALAVQHLHFRGFAHRDIKPANMLITPELRVKLIDFDTAKIFIGKFMIRRIQSYFDRTASEVKDGELAGTPAYFPPEEINKRSYGRAIDWWSVGITLYVLCAGRLPFISEDADALNKLITESKFTWPAYAELSTPTKQFTYGLLVKSAFERLGSKDYNDIFNHAFFKGIPLAEYEKGEPVKGVTFDAVDKCMNKVQAGFSPIVSAKTNIRKKKLFPKDTFEDAGPKGHVKLYTYASPGFTRCLGLLRRNKLPDVATITDPYTNNGPVKDEYRFQKELAVVVDPPHYIECRVCRTRGLLSYEPWGFEIIQQDVVDLTDGKVKSHLFTISEVKPQSPADRAGLVHGDLIQSINGRNVMQGDTPIKMITDIMKANLERLELYVSNYNTFRLFRDRNDMYLHLARLSSGTTRLCCSKTSRGLGCFGLTGLATRTVKMGTNAEEYYLVVDKTKNIRIPEVGWSHLYVGDIILAVNGMILPTENPSCFDQFFAGHSGYIEVEFAPFSPVRVERAEKLWTLISAFNSYGLEMAEVYPE